MWWKARDRARRRNGDTPAVDEVDGRLLGLLAEDATLIYTELGKRLNLSAPAKQAAGIIRRTVAVLDANLVGKPLLAFVGPWQGFHPRVHTGTVAAPARRGRSRSAEVEFAAAEAVGRYGLVPASASGVTAAPCPAGERATTAYFYKRLEVRGEANAAGGEDATRRVLMLRVT